MRKTLFIFILLFFSFSLFALDPYVEKRIDKGVDLALSGLMDPTYTLLSYEEKEDESLGRATISITLEIADETYHVSIADKNLKNARKQITNEVKRSLKYIFKVQDAELVLDYEFDTSFSSLTDEQLKNGSTFIVKGIDEKVYGLLVVRNEKGNDEVTIYDALYDKGIKPGMKLEKTGSNLLSFGFGIDPYKVGGKLCYGLFLDYKNLSLIYPFAPKAGFELCSIVGRWHYLFDIGIEYTLPLSTFFTTTFTLFQDANVTAGLSFALGTEGSTFLYGARFDLTYTWFITSDKFLSLAYEQQVLASAKDRAVLYPSLGHIILKGGIRF